MISFVLELPHFCPHGIKRVLIVDVALKIITLSFVSHSNYFLTLLFLDISFSIHFFNICSHNYCLFFYDVEKLMLPDS